MATYYRWRQSTVNWEDSTELVSSFTMSSVTGTLYFFYDYEETLPISDGNYDFSGGHTDQLSKNATDRNRLGSYSASVLASEYYYLYGTDVSWNGSSITGSGGNITKHSLVPSPGTPIAYVYSTSPSAYPNGGVSGSYYYDQRTTVTSPTAPTGLTYPETITTPSVSISWTAATSNVPNYTVNQYEVSYSTNGGSGWTVAGTTAETSYSFSVPAGTTSIMFRVRPQDSNNQWGAYKTGTASQVLLSPTLTVPQMVMQGQSATISWSAIEGADSYTLQRKSSADADWTQVYSGANLSYSETVGTWTSLQYRVQAVFDETPGGWATSDPIQIVSASALVISGQDGDLGTLTSDVPYSISSDQNSPTIDVTVEVNGGEYAAFQATSGQTYTIGVLDLPTGTGSIVITATTTVSESPVTVTRTWTYSKTAQTFPNSGSVATLTKEGNVVYPETLVEAVRASMTPWGGNLSTVLELLKRAALFNRTKQPKYSEVTVSMANVTEGQIVNIPRGGVMTPHYVGKLEYETSLNGAGRRLLVPVECYDQRVWDAGSVNAYATSDIDGWMNGEYKALFPEEIQTAMGTTKFYYTPGNGNNTVGTLERAIFALSLTELGKSHTYANTEGSALPIASTLQIVYQGGSVTDQWTRTPSTGDTVSAWELDPDGSIERSSSGGTYGSRPVFTLQSTFSGTYYVDQNGNIHDQQEYTEAGDWLDVWGNAIPAIKMETGSYVGTGTYGASNPTSLTFSFEPKLVILFSGGDFAILMAPNTNTFGINTANAWALTVSWSGMSVSWYHQSNASYQFNQNSIEYNYTAIG